MKQTQIQQQKKRKWLEPVIHGIFLMLGLITVGFVLLISIYLGTSLLAGALTLVIMNLPTVTRTTQESLKTVPQSYREGAFGLGAGKWRVIRTLRQKLGDCGSRIETVRHVGYRRGAKE